MAGVIVVVIAALAGVVALVAGIVSDPSTGQVCVDSHGNVRLLSQDRTGNTGCASDERLVELSTDERILTTEASVRAIGPALEELEQRLQALEGSTGSLPSDVGSRLGGLTIQVDAMTSLIATLREQYVRAEGLEVQTAGVRVLTDSVNALLLRIQALEQGTPPVPTSAPTPTLVPTSIPTPVPTPTPTQNPTAGLAAAVLGILGPTGSVMPLTRTGQGSGFATLTGAQASTSTFTWSGLPFKVPPVTTGTVPLVSFDGLGEFASTPDTVYWTPGDGNRGHAFSVGAWVFTTAPTNVVTYFSVRTILGKYGVGSGEWLFRVNADNKLLFVASDKSKQLDVLRTTNSPLSAGTWLHVVAVYDADNSDWTGSTAMDFVTLYINGVAIASTSHNNSGYEAIEDLATSPSLGSYLSGNFFKGQMAGGPLGPFVMHAALGVDQVNKLYEIGRAIVDP